MKKLIELLNEFRPTVNCANFKEHYEFIDDDIYLIREGIDGEEEHFPMYVCYKKGDFIKWLVENDKVNRDEIIVNSDFMPIAFDRKGEKYEWSEEKQLLMLLSISDTPIEDLISYLK